RTTARRLRLPRRRLAVGRTASGFERADRARHVVVARLPVRNGDADRATAVPRRPAEPRLAALLDAAQHLVRSLVRLEPEQHLVQYHLVQELEARQDGKLVGEASRVRAGPFDEVGDALPS